MADEMPRYQTKAAYAAAVLRRAFSEGKYAPGDRLQIGKLARELGLSLTPVREALFELASEGLIDMHPHRGARVADVSMTDLTEVYQLREALESLAARLAAERASGEALAALTAAHERFVAAVKAGERDRLRELSDDFHDLIYEMAGAPMLRRLIRQVWGSAPADTFTVVKGRVEHSVEHHRKILMAIESHDGGTAEALMRAHIADSLDLIKAAKVKPQRKRPAAAPKQTIQPEA